MVALAERRCVMIAEVEAPRQRRTDEARDIQEEVDFSKMLSEKRGEYKVNARSLACDERAVNDDRRWFASHPRRTHRIRPPGIGERQAMRDYPAMRPFIVVRQVQPGVRIRQCAWLTARVPNLEEIAHAVFDLALDAAANNRHFVPPEIVRARALTLAAGGRA